jgi:hypothetical protein
MAESTLDSELFFLINKWGPPHPSYNSTIPQGTGKWDGAATQNIAAPTQYPVGTVIQRYHYGTGHGASAGQDGYYQMAYLRAEAAVAAAKDICIASETDDHYAVERDPDALLDATNFLIGVGIAAMTAQYYGWFWVGGVCPENDVTSTMGGNYRTDGTVAIGPIDVADVSTTDNLGFALSAVESCGFAYSADA